MRKLIDRSIDQLPVCWANSDSSIEFQVFRQILERWSAVYNRWALGWCFGHRCGRTWVESCRPAEWSWALVRIPIVDTEHTDGRKHRRIGEDWWKTSSDPAFRTIWCNSRSKKSQQDSVWTRCPNHKPIKLIKTRHTYISLNFGRHDRSVLVQNGIDFLDHIEIGFVVGIFDIRSTPGHVGQLTGWQCDTYTWVWRKKQKSIKFNWIQSWWISTQILGSITWTFRSSCWQSFETDSADESIPSKCWTRWQTDIRCPAFRPTARTRRRSVLWWCFPYNRQNNR